MLRTGVQPRFIGFASCDLGYLLGMLSTCGYINPGRERLVFLAMHSEYHSRGLNEYYSAGAALLPRWRDFCRAVNYELLHLGFAITGHANSVRLNLLWYNIIFASSSGVPFMIVCFWWFYLLSNTMALS